MSNQSIKSSLINLRQSLEDTKNIDEETLALAQSLEADIQRILDTEQDKPVINGSVDLALALETRFESEHPVAAGCVREIINMLHKMGI